MNAAAHGVPPFCQAKTSTPRPALVTMGFDCRRNRIVVETIEWTEKGVVMIDQTVLPTHERYVTLTDVDGVAEAIRSMKIRGAPAIGVAAAMGTALAAQAADPDHWLEDLEAARKTLAATRPTAVNLFWALERMMEKARSTRDPQSLVAEAQAIKTEDIAMNESMGRHG